MVAVVGPLVTRVNGTATVPSSVPPVVRKIPCVEESVTEPAVLVVTDQFTGMEVERLMATFSLDGVADTPVTAAGTRIGQSNRHPGMSRQYLLDNVMTGLLLEAG